MQLSDAIYGRRAVREYTDQPVEEQQIKTLIDAAIQAPSAMNRQPWAFYVVRDQKKLARISDASKAHMLRTAPVGLVSHHFEEILENAEFQIFYHAPVLIVICATEAGDWGIIDCALAAQNLMLAAHETGLGSCWIGFAQAWLGTKEGRSMLELPKDHAPVAPIVFGHPAHSVARVSRRVPEIRFVG